MSEYNGWKNYQTWNVALWLQNDEGLYNLTKEVKTYPELVELLERLDLYQTPDQVFYSDAALDIEALNRVVEGD